MCRGPTVAIALATLLFVSASACGEELASDIPPDTSTATDGGGSSDGTPGEGQSNVSADGSANGDGSIDGNTPLDGSAEAGKDAASGAGTWSCSNKTRSYSNVSMCQNAHDALCQPTNAAVDQGLPCASPGDIYITCGPCNAQNDFNSRDCLCLTF